MARHPRFPRPPYPSCPPRLALLVLLALAAAAGCRTADSLREALSPPPWERYAAALRDAGLDGSEVGRAWFAAADRALADPPLARPPAEEVLYFDPAAPTAAGWRLELRRGQRLTVAATPQPGLGGRLFVDLFRAPDPATAPGGEPERAGWAGEGEPLELEVRRDGAYLLRLQPELLAGGRWTVRLRVEGSLTFPVEGADAGAIGSTFGDSRDGGRRRHLGVDIFAPRGTPALAAADGLVRAGTNELGGKVVWLYASDLGLTFYYAHLDRQLARTGARVKAGEPVGRVGNTGNARATRPHLHFGIYDDGAVDPFPFLWRPRGGAAPLAVAVEALGHRRRIAGRLVRLRGGPGTDTPIRREMDGGTLVEVRGATAEWYRVGLPDGAAGYVAGRLTEPAERPLARLRAPDGGLLLARPDPAAPAVAALPAGGEVAVLGVFAGFRWVEAAGRRGWLPAALLAG